LLRENLLTQAAKSTETVMGCKMRPGMLATGFACLIATLHCYGQAPPQAHSSELTVEAIRARLDLTPEQQRQITPLVTEYRKSLAEFRANLDRSSSVQTKRGLLLQVAGIQEEFNSKVTPLLTDAQRAEWKKIRAEMRDELKERWRAK
jgi:hypothetical protein